MDEQNATWCAKDNHQSYEYFSDFNHWLENHNDGRRRLKQFGVDKLSQPSKALYAGDPHAYQETYKNYFNTLRRELLCETLLTELSSDNHWYERNSRHFDQLLAELQTGNVVPFIGAGLSVAGGFPTWQDHLRQQGKTAHIDPKQIEELLAAGEYENVIGVIEKKRSREVFVQEIQDAFDHGGSVPEVIRQLKELFSGVIITTNYDRLIEQAYRTGKKTSFHLISYPELSVKPDRGKVNIYKLHGDIGKPNKCILGKAEYDIAYGANGLDMERLIPKFLADHFKHSNLLFLGCSLNNDRTIQTFRKVMDELGDGDRRQHFSIEQTPANLDELADRHAWLKNLGITAIWFKTGCFESIEKILNLAKQEISYRKIQTVDEINEVEPADSGEPGTQEIDFSIFLRDLNDLLPLLYWHGRTVPQTETSKYLLAMQQIFHAYSTFTEQTNGNLLYGLDLLLRALATKSEFDGYTQDKLSGAFGNFQHYLQTIGENNDTKEKFEWNFQELLTIPLHQFDSLLKTKTLDKSTPDYHAIRLIIALLQHGKNQLHSPKEYCELPKSVNEEFGDYLALTVSAKLGVVFPDRLDDWDIRDINNLSEEAWKNFNRDDMKIGFFGMIRLRLFGRWGFRS